MHTHRPFRLPRALAASAALALISVLALPAAAQEGELHSEYGPDEADQGVVTAPLLVPTVEDFAPVDTDAGDGADDASATGPSADKSLLSNAGISTYLEVGTRQKAGLLTPYYSFSPNLKVKARVPLIWDRTLEYDDGDTSRSGLGDVTLEGEFKRYARRLGAMLGLQLSVKTPTGGDEVELDDNGNPKPTLGTGTWDVLGRASLAKSMPTSGLVATLLYRRSGGTETVSDWGTGTNTYESRNGGQLLASAFYRRQATPKLWWHLGLSLALLRDGDWETRTVYTDGTPDYSDSGSIDQSGRLLDLYPGISYDLGPISPFLGVRLPVVTSLDNAFADEERDWAVIFQFSYSPGKLGGGG